MNTNTHGQSQHNGNGDKSVPATNRPLWQQISGIDPQTESEMTRAERNAALRKLIAEVTQRSTAEFADEDDGEIPEGERTIFWDPLQRVCMELGISRTKLSAYSRELTGMRAHEISDRILARRKLLERLSARVEQILAPELEDLRQELMTHQMDYSAPGFQNEEAMGYVRWMKAQRKFERAASFAAEMGFANYSRLNRACMLAFGKSLDQIEAELVCTQVQKFFEGLKTEQSLTQRRKDRKEQPKQEPVLTDEEKAAGDRIIKEVVAEVLGMQKQRVCVA